MLSHQSVVVQMRRGRAKCVTTRGCHRLDLRCTEQRMATKLRLAGHKFGHGVGIDFGTALTPLWGRMEVLVTKLFGPILYHPLRGIEQTSSRLKAVVRVAVGRGVLEATEPRRSLTEYFVGFLGMVWSQARSICQ